MAHLPKSSFAQAPDDTNVLQQATRALTSGRLIPATDWPQHHSWPPIGGLRHLIFFAKTNGFDKVIRRVGRRVLIDEAAFFAWVGEQGAQQ